MGIPRIVLSPFFCCFCWRWCLLYSSSSHEIRPRDAYRSLGEPACMRSGSGSEVEEKRVERGGFMRGDKRATRDHAVLCDGGARNGSGNGKRASKWALMRAPETSDFRRPGVIITNRRRAPPRLFDVVAPSSAFFPRALALKLKDSCGAVHLRPDGALSISLGARITWPGSVPRLASHLFFQRL